MKFTIGVNYGDRDLIDRLYDLLFDRKDRVFSLYGSIPNSILGTAREADRIAGKLKDIEYVVDKFSSLGIHCFYASNSLLITPSFIRENERKIRDFLRKLKSCGVKGVITASPPLISLLKEEEFLVSISTILHVDNLKMVEYYVSLEVDVIVLSLYANRNFPFLKRLKKYVETIPVKIEVLVNEICLPYCPFRVCHYIQESTGKADDWYVRRCFPMIIKDFPKNIIHGFWIRPEDIKFYAESYGIDLFKITGRTFNSKKLLKIIESYLNFFHDGNLMDLFPIVPGSLRLEKDKNFQLSYAYSIPNRKLDGFIEKYPKRVNCEIDCYQFGGKCDYCKKWIDTLQRR